MVVKSRGYGKTWLTALCCIAMGVLYPGSLIAVVSGTAEQATLIVKKIQDYFIRNPEIMREIQCDGHRPVQLSRNKGICTLKNGSKIVRPVIITVLALLFIKVISDMVAG